MAFIFGVLVLIMLLAGPDDTGVGRLGMVAGAFVLIVLSLPLRKGVAIAVDIWIDPTKDP
jgi:hypothetical protein